MRKSTSRSHTTADESLRETTRYVERLWRACEEVRLHCRRQREMIDAQRRFLRELEERRADGGRAAGAPRAATSHGEPAGAISDGE